MAKKKTTTLKELQRFIKAKGKEYRTDMNDVPAWVIIACAEFIDSKNAQIPEKKILQTLRNSISGSDLEYEDDKAIVEFLRNANEKTLDKMADGYKIELFKGYKIEISMWQPLEHFTLRMLKEHIGL